MLWRCFLQCNINVVSGPLQKSVDIPTLGLLLGLADSGKNIKKSLIQWETFTQELCLNSLCLRMEFHFDNCQYSFKNLLWLLKINF